MVEANPIYPHKKGRSALFFFLGGSASGIVYDLGGGFCESEGGRSGIGFTFLVVGGTGGGAGGEGGIANGGGGGGGEDKSCEDISLLIGVCLGRTKRVAVWSILCIYVCSNTRVKKGHLNNAMK